jgi:hypothetical protein
MTRVTVHDTGLRFLAAAPVPYIRKFGVFGPGGVFYQNTDLDLDTVLETGNEPDDVPVFDRGAR